MALISWYSFRWKYVFSLGSRKISWQTRRHLSSQPIREQRFIGPILNRIRRPALHVSAPSLLSRFLHVKSPTDAAKQQPHTSQACGAEDAGKVSTWTSHSLSFTLRALTPRAEEGWLLSFRRERGAGTRTLSSISWNIDQDQVCESSETDASSRHCCDRIETAFQI